MIVGLLTEHHLEFLSLKGGWGGSSESTHVKMPHCWKSHATAHVHARFSDRQIHALFVLALLRVNNVCKSDQYPYQAFLFLFDLSFYIPVSISSVMMAWAFLCCASTKQRIMSCPRTKRCASGEA